MTIIPAGAVRPAALVRHCLESLTERSFQELLRASVESQWQRFAYYRQLCARRNIYLADLLAIIADGAYHRLPSVASSAFKLSKGMIEELNDLSVPGVFQMSSSTSGDPSYVYTGPAELAQITERYGETFAFADVPVGLAFAPSLRILRALSKKGALNGRPAVLRMQLGLEGSTARYEHSRTTVDVDIPRTLLNRLGGRPACIRKMPASEVAAIVRDAATRGQGISLGGLALLLRPYLDEFREGEFALHSLGHVAFSGGGYSGAKGSIRGARIDKPAFVARIGAVFGIEPALWPTHIKDIYSFTETSAQIEGFWSCDLDDFLFRPAARPPGLHRRSRDGSAPPHRPRAHQDRRALHHGPAHRRQHRGPPVRRGRDRERRRGRLGLGLHPRRPIRGRRSLRHGRVRLQGRGDLR